MDDSLESLLEKATNPKNKYEDWEFIMAFCDRVNTEMEGPQVALKIIVPKLKSDNEKVCMLALTLLEACVKNCGQRFHQELGKFRFLNELIKLLSHKYLGSKTPPVVKNKVKELLYSWKIGLPTEVKIGEAYEMLKKEGLVFDESQVPDVTLQPEKQKPKISLIQDPKQSKMLHKLLASRNPDDLRAANRLIRDMVRRDDKRMERLKRRLDELELVQNNIKLMNELLSHYKPGTSSTEEKQLLEELYRSLETMRPNVFRMASNLKQEEEGMDEILQTNDDLLRVMDTFKRVVGMSGVAKEGATGGEGGASDGVVAGGAATGEQMGTLSERPEESGAVGGGGSEVMGGGGGGGGEGEDILIDLADLDFGYLPTPVGVGGQQASGGVPPSTGDSLLDTLGAFDFSATGTPPSQNTSFLDFPPMLTNLAPAPQPQATGVHPFPTLPSSTTSSQPPPTQPFILPPPPAPQNSITPVFGRGSPSSVNRQAVPTSSAMTMAALTNQMPPASITPSTNATGANLFGDLALNLNLGSPMMQQPKLAGTGTLGQISMAPTTVAPQGKIPTAVAPQAGWGAFQSDPLAVLDNVFVSKDKIQTGTLPPLQVLSKNGITVAFHFTKNVPAQHVSVVVISAISTNNFPVSQFQTQVAVPKVMRVKLQPPTATDLASFNPVLPPSNVSQIMLLANPTKAKIRLKYRISWQQEGQETVEMGEVADFPAI